MIAGRPKVRAVFDCMVFLFSAEASYLVTRDADVLDLGATRNPDALRLQRSAPKLRILDPVSFLIEIRRTLEAPAKSVDQ